VDEYLIYSHEHQAWWGPGHCGYTFDDRHAGWYTQEQANAIVTGALDGWHPKPDGSDLLPHEVMVRVDSASLITAVAVATVLLVQERGRDGVPGASAA
jgi:hypothetical protein